MHRSGRFLSETELDTCMCVHCDVSLLRLWSLHFHIYLLGGCRDVSGKLIQMQNLGWVDIPVS